MNIFSMEAEQSVLGACIISNHAVETATDILTAEDFFDRTNSQIFASITTIAGEGKEVDVVSLGEHMETHFGNGQLAYLMQLGDFVPSAANVKAYAKVVKDKSERRTVNGLLTSYIDMVSDGSAQLDNTLASLAEALGRTQGADSVLIRSANEILKSTVDKIDGRYRAETKISGLPTGIKALDDRFLGFADGDMIVLAGRPSMGKAQPLDSKILLSNGQFKRMGDIQVGDNLASVDGRGSKVVAIHPQGLRPTMKVTFSDGREVLCDEDHLWDVGSCRWDQRKIVQTKELMDLNSKSRLKGRISVPGFGGLFGASLNECVDPWLLGVILGDGSISFRRCAITNTSDYIYDRISKSLPEGCGISERNDNDTFYVNFRGKGNPVVEWLENEGLIGCRSYEKFIPEKYMTASVIERLGLAIGLIETDGTVEKTGAITYTTTSRRMADQMKRIVWSLGGRCSISSRIPKFTGADGSKKEGRRAYTLYITSQMIAASIAEPVRRSKVTRTKPYKTYITNVEYVESKECQCITVSHPTSLYITDGYIPTHNSVMAWQITLNTIIDNKKSVFFSLEMTADQLMERALANIGRIDLGQIKNPKEADEEFWPKMSRASAIIKDKPIIVDETPSLHINQICARARATHRKSPVRLVVVDHIHLVRADGQSREREIAHITSALKGLAKELDCPVIAVAQLNRGVEQRQNKRPMMSDLRDSGSIEQDADKILLMYRDDYYYPENSPQPGVLEVITGKYREGETGTDYLAAKLHQSRIADMSGDFKPKEQEQTQDGFEY